MRRLAAAALLAAAPAALAFDANGVAIGAREVDVKKAFPSARCKPLEWKTDAAERRCDDSRISLAGVPAKITFYLKADAIQAFDLRFDVKDRAQVAAHLKGHWGKPLSEATETISRVLEIDPENARARAGIHKARLAAEEDHVELPD